MKIFINKVGALHRQWGDKIPLPHQAFYILAQDKIEANPQTLTSGDFPDQRAVELLENKNARESLAALHFGVEPEKALGVIIRPKIHSALWSGDPLQLQELEKTDGFFQSLDAVLSQICSGQSQEPRYIAIAAAACSEINSLDRYQKRVIWERLRNGVEKANRFMGLDAKNAAGVAAVLRNTESPKLETFAEKISQSITDDSSDQDEKAAKAWGQGAAILLRQFHSQGLLESIKQSFRVPGSPALYLKALEEMWPAVGSELRGLLKPKCKENAVIDHLSKLWGEKQPTQIDLQALQLVTAVFPGWSFGQLVQTLQNKLTSTGALIEAATLLEAIDLLGKTQNPEAIRAMRWLSRNGIILNFMWMARSTNNFPVFGQLSLKFFESNDDLGVEQHAGNSQNGLQAFKDFLNSPESPFGPATDEWTKRITADHKLEWLLSSYKGRPNFKNLFSAILRRIASNSGPENVVTAGIFSTHFQVFNDCLTEDDMKTLVKRLCQDGQLRSALVQKPFQKELATVWLTVLLEEPVRSVEFEELLVAGLKAISQDVWKAELIREGKMLELVLAIIQRGGSPDLTSAFENALTEHTKNFAEGKQQRPTKLLAKWPLVPAALAPHSRHTFYATLSDLIERWDQPTREKVLLLYESGFFPPSLTHEDSDQIVRLLFREIVKVRKPLELDWLRRALAVRGEIFKSAQIDSQKSFCDDLRAALSEVSDESIKNKLRGMLQMSTINQNQAPKEFGGASFMLPATDATLYGQSICVEILDGKPNIGYWHYRDDFPEWTVKLERSAKFRVSLEFACAPDCGGDFVLTIGDKSLTAKIPETGGWDKFQSLDFENVQLSEGKHSISVKSGSEFKQALMNLRSINFVPVG